MMDVLTIAHWFSLMVFMIIFWKAFSVLKWVHRCHKVDKLKETLTCFIILIITQAIVFIYLQLSWIFSGSEHIDTPNAVLWLTYDILNGCAMMAYLISLELYLKWRCVEDSCKHFRRRKDDP